MFAILINEANMPEILQNHHLTEKQIPGLELFKKAKADFYFVSGYYSPGRAPKSWSVLPEHKLKNYIYDANTINTKWTQIFHRTEAN